MTTISEREFPNLIEKGASSIPFKSEDLLISAVINKIDQFIDGDNIMAFKEIIIGAGTVDVVAGQVEKIPDMPCESLLDMEAYVLSKLHLKKGLTAKTIAYRTLLPLDEATKILYNLTYKGYCELSGNCYLRSKSHIHALAAIEGKIKNWKRALTQAHRNRLFTSQTFVALDAKYSKPALENINVFRRSRVGLAIVFSDGEVCVIYKPPKTQPLAPVMPFIAESMFLASLLQ